MSVSLPHVSVYPLSVAAARSEFENVLRTKKLGKQNILKSTNSLSELVNLLIEESGEEYLLLHRPEVIVDEGLLAVLADVIADLNKRYSNWGVCGATGVRWDGAKSYWYVRRKPRAPESSTCARPVISVGSEVLLFNVRYLSSIGCRIEANTDHWFEVGPLLALECLLRNSCVLVDPRLMVVDGGEEPSIEEAEALKSTARKNLINHKIPTPYGALVIDGVNFQEYLALPPVAHGKKDLMTLFDSSLRAARDASPITVSIACRSQLSRPYLLERAMLSFAAAQEACPSWLAMKVVLLSDRPHVELTKATELLKARFPSLSIADLHVGSRSRQTSRIDHLLTAIDSLESDFIWFIDDDDFVMPGALQALARTLIPGAPVLLLGTSEVLDEQWTDSQLARFQSLARFPSSRVFEVFKGENYVPICSMLVPTKLARERCAEVTASGEYLEDYFILLRLLTSQRVEVEMLPAAIAGISLRGTENTVRQSKNDTWTSSYAQFVGEILRAEDSNNPLLWQLVRDR